MTGLSFFNEYTNPATPARMKKRPAKSTLFPGMENAKLATISRTPKTMKAMPIDGRVWSKLISFLFIFAIFFTV